MQRIGTAAVCVLLTFVLSGPIRFVTGLPLQATLSFDVVLFVIDGEAGIREQDKHVAGYAYEAGKPMIVVFNKWDVVEKDERTINTYTDLIRKEFIYLTRNFMKTIHMIIILIIYIFQIFLIMNQNLLII